jgi:hypothetical protein
MRKINFLFAVVFAAAIIIGGVNVFTAVDKKSVYKDSINVINKEGIDTVNKKDINVVRRGRKIQVDGFLLEWRGTDANVWPGTDWRWDAVSTADGIAGYVSLPSGSIDAVNNAVDSTVGVVVNDTVRNDTGINTSSRSDWLLTLKAVNTGRSLTINLPGQPAGKFFAFDKAAFDAGGPLTAEWFVPWDFFDDDSDDGVYKLSINAVNAGGKGVLRPLVLTVEVPGEPQAPSGLFTRLTMVALIAVLTIALVVIRRRQMKEKHLI